MPSKTSFLSGLSLSSNSVLLLLDSSLIPPSLNVTAEIFRIPELSSVFSSGWATPDPSSVSLGKCCNNRSPSTAGSSSTGGGGLWTSSKKQEWRCGTEIADGECEVMIFYKNKIAKWIYLLRVVASWWSSRFALRFEVSKDVQMSWRLRFVCYLPSSPKLNAKLQSAFSASVSSKKGAPAELTCTW